MVPAGHGLPAGGPVPAIFAFKEILMKKTLILIMAAALLLAGCAGFKQALCSPTADQVAQAAQAAAQIAALIPFLQTIPQAALIVAALNAVLPGVNQLRQGYCVADQDNFLKYVLDLITQADVQAMQYGFAGLKAKGLK